MKIQKLWNCVSLSFIILQLNFYGFQPTFHHLQEPVVEHYSVEQIMHREQLESGTKLETTW